MARTTTKRDAALALIRRQVEVFADRPLHLPHRGSGVDGGDELLALEDLDERLGLLVVLGETDGERLGVVVVTSREAATAHVADVGHLRTVRDQVVVEAALRAQPPCEYPTMHLLVGQVEVDDPVDVVALQEELCLPGAAREPVDDEAVVPVMVVQSLPDDCLDHVVADQPPAGNGAAHLRAELRVMLHVPPEDVADADVLEVEVVGEKLGLCALAAALDAHDHELAHGISSAGWAVGLDSFEDLDGIADANRIARRRGVRDELHAEPGRAVPPPDLGQRRNRLLALGRGLGIDQRHDAPVAALDGAKRHAADAQTAPAVLGPWGGARDDEVRPKPGDRQRALSSASTCDYGDIERGQRVHRGNQQRVRVGEADPVVRRAEVRARTTAGRVVQVYEPCGRAEQLAEPRMCIRRGRRRGELVAVHVDRDQLGVGRLHDQLRAAGRAQPQAVAVETDVDQDELGVFASRHARAARVDDHPPAIAGEPPRLDLGVQQLLAPAGLDRVAIDAREGDRHPARIKRHSGADRLLISRRNASRRSRVECPVATQSSRRQPASAERCSHPGGHWLAPSSRSGNAHNRSSGVTCASPNDRTPGVSITQPSSSGRRSATAELDVCRPMPNALTTPVARRASGTSRLISVDLPTPECPTNTDICPVSRANRSARSLPRCVTTAARSSWSYRARTSSGPARSDFVRHSSGSMPAARAATTQRSISPYRGGGSSSDVTITSWSALATITRSCGSLSSAVRRSTVSRSRSRTMRPRASGPPDRSPTTSTRSPTARPLRPSSRARMAVIATSPTSTP